MQYIVYVGPLAPIEIADRAEAIDLALWAHCAGAKVVSVFEDFIEPSEIMVLRGQGVRR